MTHFRRLARITTTILIGISVLASTSFAADKGLPPAQQSVLTKAVNTAKQFDASKAIEFLQSSGSDKQVAANSSQIVRNLYFKEKDVPRMILFARAGIRYCLDRARSLQETDHKSALVFKGTAKTIAFNLGANTWPGWQDQGISITATDLAIGLDAAKTNLRLGVELKRDDKVMGNAHWLIGAHLLAAGKYGESQRALRKSVERFQKAKKTALVLMAEGYLAIVELAKKPKNHTAAKKLDATIARLNGLKSENGNAFAKQLKTVMPVFVKKH